MELIRIAWLLLLAFVRARAFDAEAPEADDAGTPDVVTYLGAISRATEAVALLDVDGHGADVGAILEVFELSQRLFAGDAAASVGFVAEAGLFGWLKLLLDHPFGTLRYNTCLFLRSSLLADAEPKKFKQDLADRMFEEGIVGSVIKLTSASDDKEMGMATYTLVDIVYLASDHHVPKLVDEGAFDVVCKAIRTVNDEAGGADFMVKALETAKKLDYREIAARKLEQYVQEQGGMDDNTQMAYLAHAAQLTKGMGASAGDGGHEPHELAIHAHLCRGWENFCTMFSCGVDPQPGAQKALGAPAEREGSAQAETQAAVARAREEARAAHGALSVAQERKHAAALESLRGAQRAALQEAHATGREEARAELEGAHAEALEQERKDRDAAIEKAVEEARREERENIYAQSALGLVKRKWGRAKKPAQEL